MDHDQVLEALLRLSEHKQRRVFERWPGITGETPEGLKVTARSAKELGRFTNTKDEGMLTWISSFEAGDVFYDIGANVGGVTLTVAGIHGDTIPIVSIEPSFANFESLARNLSLNGLLGSTIPLQVALLDETGLQPLNYRNTAAAGTALHAVGTAVDHLGKQFTPVEVQQVPTYRLDDLIHWLKLPAPTVVKVDVDGFEESVLRGASRTLGSGTVRELKVEIYDHDHTGTRLKAITQFLEGWGYELSDSFRHGDSAGFVADQLFRRSPSHQKSFSAVSSIGSGNTTSEQLPATDKDRRTPRLPIFAARTALEQRNATLKEKYRALKETNARLRRELRESRESYYMTDAGNKVDLREIEGFSEVARMVMDEGRSGMNYDRLYALWQAVVNAPPDLPILEVGSYRGGSAKFIAEALRHKGRAPKFYVCDTFEGHPRTDPVNDLPSPDGYYFQNTSAEDVARYLEGYANVELVVGDILETAGRLTDEAFGFVHVDVDLYEATDFCLRVFAPRLARDAVMLIDDYGVHTCPGTQKAVDDFVAATPDFRLFHLLSGQAILFRVS